MIVNLLIFLFFFFSSIAITWPLILNLSTLIIDPYDGLLITWIINWDIHSIKTNLFQLFNSNIFYPYKNTLAYSNLHLADALLALPLSFFSKEPLLSFNINFLAGFFLTAFFTYQLILFLTKNKPASFIGGSLFTFSSLHLSDFSHLQIFNFWLLPLSILFFLKYQKNEKKRYFFISILFFILQTLNSFITGLFIALFVFVYSLTKKKYQDLIKFFLISGIILLPFIIPFFQVSQEFNYQRPITDAIHFSLQPKDLISSPPISNLFQVFGDHKHISGWLGLIFIILIGLTIPWLIKRKKYSNPFLITGVIAFILSFGPALHWARKTIHLPFKLLPVIPLPYTLLYYLIPGFSGFRNPSRWLWLFAFCTSILISLMIKDKLKNKSQKKQFFISLLIVLGIFIEVKLPLKFSSVPSIKRFPQVYYWLKKQPPNTPIIELPIYYWGSGENLSKNTLREYYSTLHFQPRINGFSGFTPPDYEKITKQLLQKPLNNKQIKYFKKIGVKYIVVHPKDYPFEEKNRLLRSIKELKTIKKIKQFKDKVIVYQLVSDKSF